jgi:excisionase family DNA binding protein
MASKAPEIAKEFEPRWIVYPIEKRLYTIPEAAKYLCKGVDAVREMVYRREIPIIQRGERGKVYLDLLDLDAWIRTNKRFSGEM